MTQITDLFAAMGNFMGCVGVMDAVIDGSESEDVKQAWQERLEAIVQDPEEETQNLIEFGERFDPL